MRLNYLIFILPVFIMTSACVDSKSHKEKAIGGPAIVSDTINGKYEIKSGIIEYISTMSGSRAKQTLFFDNYGNEESTETIINIGGLEITTVSLVKDDFVYSYNPSLNKGTKVKILGRQTSNINFRNMSEDRRRKMNLEMIDTVLIDGRTCVRYSEDWVEMSMTGIYTVWKGITLESEIKISNVDMVMKATNIIENPVIPASRFELPDDIKLN